MVKTMPLDAAMEYINLGIPVVPCHEPAVERPGVQPRPDCSCGDLACPVPAQHPVGALDSAILDSDRAASWFASPSTYNIGSVTGIAFDVVTLRHPWRPEQIRVWLEAHRVEPGPVLDGGRDTLLFLVSVGEPTERCFAAAKHWPVTRLAHGSVVLLPPSRLATGHAISWLTGPKGIALPDGEELFQKLTRLPRPWTAW